MQQLLLKKYDLNKFLSYSNLIFFYILGYFAFKDIFTLTNYNIYYSLIILSVLTTQKKIFLTVLSLFSISTAGFFSIYDFTRFNQNSILQNNRILISAICLVSVIFNFYIFSKLKTKRNILIFYVLTLFTFVTLNFFSNLPNIRLITYISSTVLTYFVFYANCYTVDLKFKDFYKIMPGWIFPSYIPFFLFNSSSPKKYRDVNHAYVAKLLVNMLLAYLVMKYIFNQKQNIEDIIALATLKSSLLLILIYLNVSVTLLIATLLGYETMPPMLNIMKARTYHQFLFFLTPFYCLALSNSFSDLLALAYQQRNKFKRSLYVCVMIFIFGTLLHLPKYFSWVLMRPKTDLLTILNQYYFKYYAIVCTLIFISLLSNSIQHRFSNKYFKAILFLTVFFSTLYAVY